MSLPLTIDAVNDPDEATRRNPVEIGRRVSVGLEGVPP